MEELVQAVYDSLQGDLLIPVPGVENAFEEGKPCAQWYEDMLEAYERLCQRLGATDDDEDVEIIIHSLLQIQKTLCIKMYQYGALFTSRETGAF